MEFIYKPRIKPTSMRNMAKFHLKFWMIQFSQMLQLQLLFSISIADDEQYQKFIECLSTQSPDSITHLYNNTAPEFLPLLQSMQQNKRWLNSPTTSSAPAPVFILTPVNETEIQAAVTCSKSNGIKLRIKSGGHDYEGLSFRSNSNSSFIIIDLSQFRDIHIDLATETAWVDAGATIGELYYAISKKSSLHGFPGGTCPSVGVGGQLSGGGFGWLLRSYGLAADNVVDAHVVDASGHLLDRKTMGDDLFWAIRGGGGGSFGIITSWKVKLISVPPLVTAFIKKKLLNESATELMDQWQNIASKLPNNLVIKVMVRRQNIGGENLVEVAFNSLFLGNKSELLPIMNEKFSSLGLTESDCFEMPWINSTTLYWGTNQGNKFPLEDIQNRTDKFASPAKVKSDFVNQPIPTNALQGIWDLFTKNNQGGGFMILEPFGGKMDEISDSDLPFPYRNGTLYNIQYLIHWQNSEQEASSVEWINKLYEYMTPYVASNPRTGYVNYRDLDLGTNQLQGTTRCDQAKVWGEKYFRHNFEKLCRIKFQVDPEDFFSHEQSVPPNTKQPPKPPVKWYTGWSI